MYFIAQINLARIRAPLNDPLMEGYVNQRKAMDTLARNSPGFIWRRNGAGSDAKETDLYEDQTIIANVSVWARLEDYANFVYKSGHLEVLKHRYKWFQPFDGPYQALWWVPQGHLPPPEEARERLEYLRVHGETPYAFSLKNAFPPPDERTPTTALTS